MAQLRRDDNGSPIPTATTMAAAQVTLTGTSLNEITVPTGAVAVDISSSTTFSIAGASTESAFACDTREYFPNIMNQAKLYISGANGQVIYLLWSKL